MDSLADTLEALVNRLRKEHGDECRARWVLQEHEDLICAVGLFAALAAPQDRPRPPTPEKGR
ncbi:hypothetical protein OOK41_31435 [Micromonospora sp. NBC_01655]|uniref:hypothetical protein n=1 Tax=Micromonospora sp. NBC_01655 TaxID=2975983 RepID=UPI002251B1F9|nr:hypothetical protein [Micromonospora sp. NBC_01655]MCX4474774.1 hypothetical protein [Micromonospora sp. NBC_01655]